MKICIRTRDLQVWGTQALLRHKPAPGFEGYPEADQS